LNLSPEHSPFSCLAGRWTEKPMKAGRAKQFKTYKGLSYSSANVKQLNNEFLPTKGATATSNWFNFNWRAIRTPIL